MDPRGLWVGCCRVGREILNQMGLSCQQSYNIQDFAEKCQRTAWPETSEYIHIHFVSSSVVQVARLSFNMKRSRDGFALPSIPRLGGYSTRGIFLQSQLDVNSISLTNSEALQLCTSPPDSYGCYVGNNLARFQSDGEYQLKKIDPSTIPLAAASVDGRHSYVLLTCGSFFNFASGNWEPEGSMAPYIIKLHYLYVACKPLSEQQLLCKLGYVSEKDDWAKIIGYLESKSQLLRLTNQEAAYVFIFPIDL